MRTNTQSAADDDDTADASFAGGRIEAMEPGASIASGNAAHFGAEKSATAPGWTKRLSTRGKLTRALIPWRAAAGVQTGIVGW